jgi:hypothetical protein
MKFHGKIIKHEGDKVELQTRGGGIAIFYLQKGLDIEGMIGQNVEVDCLRFKRHLTAIRVNPIQKIKKDL